jgi:NtrC-family two-component system response regulator AlgB
VDIRIPSLRERPADILPLAKGFLAAAGGPRARLSEGAERRLLEYRWPGNVRELRNAIERALVLRPNPAADEIGEELLPQRFFEASSPAGAEALDLETAEKARILEALNRYPKLDDAAEALGIDPSTLWRKRKRLGLV